MRTTREDPQRSIDFSAVVNSSAIESAIVNLLARRKNPMREREICRWFRATPAGCISVALTMLVNSGEIQAYRTGLGRRWVLEYSIPEAR